MFRDVDCGDEAVAAPRHVYDVSLAVAPRPARAHGHERRAPRSPPLGERQAESGRIGLLAFPGDQEALQPTRHEAEQ
jgi:hypothetical protein